LGREVAQGVDLDGFVGRAGCDEGEGRVRGCEPGAGDGGRGDCREESEKSWGRW